METFKEKDELQEYPYNWICTIKIVLKQKGYKWFGSCFCTVFVECLVEVLSVKQFSDLLPFY